MTIEERALEQMRAVNAAFPLRKYEEANLADAIPIMERIVEVVRAARNGVEDGSIDCQARTEFGNCIDSNAPSEETCWSCVVRQALKELEEK